MPPSKSSSKKSPSVDQFTINLLVALSILVALSFIMTYLKSGMEVNHLQREVLELRSDVRNIESVPTTATSPTATTTNASATATTTKPAQPSTIGKAFTLKEGTNEVVTVGSNSFKIILRRLTDSRCPKNVQCIWQGELGADLAVKDTKTNQVEDVLLGQTTKPCADVMGMGIMISKISETNVTLQPVQSCK